MRKDKRLVNQITAMLLSGMLVVGLIPGAVLASDIQAGFGQTSETVDEEVVEMPSEDVTEDVSKEEGMGTEEVSTEEYSEDVITKKVKAVSSYTVTLDANGGYFVNEWDDAIEDYVQQAEVVEKHIPVDGIVAAFPVFTEKEGQSMTFAGWSLEKDGELITTGDEEYAPVDNCTLYAVWQTENGALGKTGDQEVAYENIDQTETIQESERVDTAEESEDAVTSGENPVEEDVITDFIEDTSDVTAGAGDTSQIEDTSEASEGAGQTVEEALAEKAEEAQYYTVTLEANGGYFENEWDDAIGEAVEQAEVVEKHIPVGGSIAAVPVFANQDGQTMLFVSWSLEPDGELVSPAEEEYVPVDNCVLYAVWEAAGEAADEGSGVADTARETDAAEESGDTGEEDKSESAREYEDAELEEEIATGSEDLEEAEDAQEYEETETTGEADTAQETVEDIDIDSDDYTVPENNNEQDATLDHEARYTDEEEGEISERSSDASEETNLEASEDEEIVREDATKSVVKSGTCGENLTWTLDEEGTLTVSGTGEMINSSSSTRFFYEQTRYNPIKTVIIEHGVTSIGNYDFCGCDSITGVTIPNSVTRIGDYAFTNCSSIASITIPNSVTSIGKSAFQNCSGITNLTLSNSLTIIDDSVFKLCSSLTNLTIPNSVTSIKSQAFAGCNNLTGLTIPDSVTNIAHRAFSCCSELINVSIPNTITDIKWGTFEECRSLTSVTIPNSVTSIGSSAFEGCLKLANITIPNSVKSIEKYAFHSCNSLTNVTIPNSVTSIGEEVFLECWSLNDITVDSGNLNYSSKDGVLFNKDQTILISYPNAKRGVYSIPMGVMYIEGFAFYCSSLTSVIIPNSVKNIGDHAFRGCNSLTNVTIPDSVTSIEYSAFSGCSSLTSVTISNSITSIENSAFAGCSNLTSVTIPNSVSSIGNYAFESCKSLTSIYFNGNAPSIFSNVFYKVTATAYYPVSDPTWAEEKRQNYGGTITWVPWDPGTDPIVTPDPDSFSLSIGTPTNNAIVIGEDGQLSAVAYYNFTNQNTALQEAQQINWTCSDPSAVEIYDSVYDLETKDVRISLGLRGKKPGAYTITGTAPDGRTASADVVVEPKIVAVSNNTTLTETTDVVMVQTTLNTGDRAYLTSFLNGITGEIKDDYGSIGGADNKRVEVSEDGKTGNLIYTLTPVFGGNAEFTFTSPGGQKVVEKIYSDLNTVNQRKKIGWSFKNIEQSFGYDKDYHYSLNTYGAVYGITTHSMFNALLAQTPLGKWGGNCFGMSLLAGSSYNGDIDLSPYFSREGDYLWEYGYDKIEQFEGKEILTISGNQIVHEIEKAQVSQYSVQFLETEIFKDDDYYNSLIDYLKSTDNCILIAFELDKGGHAVLFDNNREIVEMPNYPGWYRIPIYDPNVPLGKELLSNPHEWYDLEDSYIYLDTNNGYYSYRSATKDYTGEHKRWNHRNIQFFNLAALDDDYYYKRLFLAYQPNSVIFGFNAQDVDLQIDGTEVISVKDNEIVNLNNNYDYRVLYDENSSEMAMQRYMEIPSESEVAFTGNDIKAIISNEEGAFSIDSSSEIKVLSTTGSKKIEITSKQPGTVALAYTHIDDAQNSITEKCEVSLAEGESFECKVDDYVEFASDDDVVAHITHYENDSVSDEQEVVLPEPNIGIEAGEDCYITTKTIASNANTNGIEIELDKSSYAVQEGDTLTIDATIKTDKVRVEGQKEYTGYYAYYANGEWNQLASWDIEGGTSKYRIVKKIEKWAKYDDVMFTVSVFPKDNFSQGGALKDNVFLVNVTSNKYSVTIDANGGFINSEVDDVSGKEVTNADAIIKKIIKDGRVFIPSRHVQNEDDSLLLFGWSTTPDGNPVIGFNESYQPDGDCTLYAIWKHGKLTGTRLYGDFNDNGTLDIGDVLKINRHIQADTDSLVRAKHPDWILTGNDYEAADINHDAVIDDTDIGLIQQSIAVQNSENVQSDHPDWIISETFEVYSFDEASRLVTGITINKNSIVLEEGKETTLSAEVVPADTDNQSIKWSSSNTSIATVDNSGKVKGIAVGTAIITAASCDGSNIFAKCEVTVNKTLISIKNAIVSGISNKIYAGSAITQKPTVKVGDITLTKDIDYTLSYANNINVGTAALKIVGTGKYNGTKTVTFTITKAAQSITAKAAASSVAVGKATTVSITGARGTKSYKSSNTTIATVTSAGKVTAKKVGTVKITATSAATENYKAASRTVTIKVVPAATTSLTAANQVTGIKLTWKKVTGANGYKIYRGKTLIKTITSGNTVTFVDKKANTNGTKYVYKLVAKASTGDSTLSKTRGIYRVARPAISSLKNSASKKMTVKWNKNAKGNGYQIQYSKSKTFASGNKTATAAGASTVSKVITSLTKGKTYYVRVRAYKTVNNVKFFSSWSVVKSVKISK